MEIMMVIALNIIKEESRILYLEINNNMTEGVTKDKVNKEISNNRH